MDDVVLLVVAEIYARWKRKNKRRSTSREQVCFFIPVSFSRRTVNLLTDHSTAARETRLLLAADLRKGEMRDDLPAAGQL